jgi:predicted membrane channel-forming protein YqfA (hemolysin III family)
MFCPRCNKPSSDTDKCTTCGARLKTLESAKRRGWVAFGAGVFLVVFVSAVWIWVDRLMAGQAAPGAAAFVGRLNEVFALIVLCGALGMFNGWSQAHSGRANRAIAFVTLGVFAIALFLAYTASNAFSAVNPTGS